MRLGLPGRGWTIGSTLDWQDVSMLEASRDDEKLSVSALEEGDRVLLSVSLER